MSMSSLPPLISCADWMVPSLLQALPSTQAGVDYSWTCLPNFAIINVSVKNNKCTSPFDCSVLVDLSVFGFGWLYHLCKYFVYIFVNIEYIASNQKIRK